MKIRFTSISQQVAAALREEIKKHTWTNTLPSERQLAGLFQVSRKSLRRALAELRNEGLVTTANNRASIIAARRFGHRKNDRIALLLPGPLEQARPYTVLWVNRLMTLVQNRGLSLDIFHGTKYYGETASRSLVRLTATYPSRCWILARSNRSLQDWFVASGLPTLVCGSTFAGTCLASADIDHRALCRHAAAVFHRHGHRRLAIFLDFATHAGDAESEHGFSEGVASFGGTIAAVYRKAGARLTANDTIRQVKTLLAMPSIPTGWLLSSTSAYLTAHSYLGSIGLRVPRDISLICRDDDSYMNFIHPSPVRYVTSPGRFSALLNRAIKRIERGDNSAFALRIMPDLAAGGSVGYCSTKAY
jgi:DNA-binding LacI/PurR family transcriptional regulator